MSKLFNKIISFVMVLIYALYISVGAEIKGGPQIYSAKTERYGNNILVIMSGENISNHKSYAFLYDENGVFVSKIELAEADYIISEDKESLFGYFIGVDGVRVKCVVWESSESMKPLCPYAEAEVLKLPTTPDNVPVGGGGGGGG